MMRAPLRAAASARCSQSAVATWLASSSTITSRAPTSVRRPIVPSGCLPRNLARFAARTSAPAASISAAATRAAFSDTVTTCTAPPVASVHALANVPTRRVLPVPAAARTTVTADAGREQGGQRGGLVRR